MATATATRTTEKLNRLRLSKQQLCTCSKIFCTFVCSDCTTTTWWCELPTCNFMFYQPRVHVTTNLFSNLEIFLENSTPREFSYSIKQSEQVKIIDLKFHWTRSHFLGDVIAIMVCFVEIQKFCYHVNVTSPFFSIGWKFQNHTLTWFLLIFKSNGQWSVLAVGEVCRWGRTVGNKNDGCVGNFSFWSPVPLLPICSVLKSEINVKWCC